MSRRTVDRSVAVFALLIIGVTSSAFAREPRRVADTTVAAVTSSKTLLLPDTLRGKSGKLWMRVFEGTRSTGISILRQLFGDSAAARPGVYTTSETGKPFSFISLVPFSGKVKGMEM